MTSRNPADDVVCLVTVFTQTSKNVPGNLDTQLQCHQGYNLLSCGLQLNPSMGGSPEKFAIPLDENTCLCYHYNGAKCLAWCSTAVRDFQIVESVGVQAGVIRVVCPPDKSVVGCHIMPYSPSTWAFDSFQEHYPTEEGCGCICSNTMGAKCYATCAKNVRNYAVINATDSGMFYVECPFNSSVLGCGISIGQNNRYKADWNREAFAVNSTTCLCRDNNGMTCYAICGQLY